MGKTSWLEINGTFYELPPGADLPAIRDKIGTAAVDDLSTTVAVVRRGKSGGRVEESILVVMGRNVATYDAFETAN